MRVLFFLEPVIFRNSPSLISAHFLWVDYFKRACAKEGWQFALTANESTCRNWAELNPDASGAVKLYGINPFETLTAFNHERRSYARAAYSESEGNNPLFDRLAEIRELYSPTLIVMSSQNSFARHAFAGIPILSIEQAPLPRLGHPMRTAFDPSGHQTMSLLETRADKISSLALTAQVRRQAANLLSAIKQTALIADTRGVQVVAALDEFRRQGPVALLVTQPTDAVTYEGAYQPIELENLLYAWAQALPPGWIGVPTYHGGQRLSEEMEAALAAATPRLRFLPQSLSLGLSEPMLLSADGMITISSTSAMTGLLFQKRVIVTGRSPYNTWCRSDPAEIANAPVLTDDQVASILCFLTNRFTLSHEVLDETIDPLIELMKAVAASGDPVKWLTDVSDWTPEKAARLFRFRGCVKDASDDMQGCLREQLERQLAETRAQSNVFESEWKAAVADRDRLGRLLASMTAERDTLSSELAASARELEAINRDVTDRVTNWNSQWSTAIADWDHLREQVTALVSERDSIQKEAIAAADMRDRLAQDLSAIAVERDALHTAQATLVGDQERLQEALTVEVARGNDLLTKLASIAQERDDQRGRNQALEATKDRIARELADRTDQETTLRAALAAAVEQNIEAAQELADVISKRDAVQAERTTLLEKRDQLEQALAVEMARGDRLGAECELQITELDRLVHELAHITQQHATACSELGTVSTDRDRLARQLRSYTEWIKTYRHSIASLPLWRLAMHYRNIATDSNSLNLPKEPI
ncbi:hypothetical protein R69746_08322 [Paraburkholderia aspalathi]|nr:hypothetical protein R69746_08322 [Paraburkholderia aspalathi]